MKEFESEMESNNKEVAQQEKELEGVKNDQLELRDALTNLFGPDVVENRDINSVVAYDLPSMQKNILNLVGRMSN